jgi:hypothetical protein
MDMKSWVLAAGLCAGLAATAVQAADLDDTGPPPDRRGSAYDDPRYADMYRYPPRQPAPGYAVPAPPAPGYAVPAPPPPRDYAYREDEYDRYREPRRYSYSDPRAPYGQGCVPREAIKHRLMSEGWHDFHDGELQGNLATVHARRPSGRLFRLTVDRCSGDVVTARPLEGRPYAYGPPMRRWERFY